MLAPQGGFRPVRQRRRGKERLGGAARRKVHLSPQRPLYRASLRRAAASSDYRRSDRVRSRTGTESRVFAVLSTPEIEGKVEASWIAGPLAGPEVVGTKSVATRSGGVWDCKTDGFSIVSVLQASSSQEGLPSEQSRSWTAPETVPHGAASSPPPSVTEMLAVSVSPVAPHEYCTSGALMLTSNASATTTRVFSNVRERNRMWLSNRFHCCYIGVERMFTSRCLLFVMNEEERFQQKAYAQTSLDR